MPATSRRRHVFDPSASDSEPDSEHLAEPDWQEDDPFGYNDFNKGSSDVSDASPSARGDETTLHGAEKGKPKRLKNPIPAEEITERLCAHFKKIRTQKTRDLLPLKTILDSWYDQRNDYGVPFPALAHILEESYDVDDNQFSAANLRGTDAILINRLEKACKDTGFYLCLASMLAVVRDVSDDMSDQFSDPYNNQRYRSRYRDERHETADGTFCLMKNFVDIDGQSLFRSLKRNLPKESLLESHYFSTNIPDHKEVEIGDYVSVNVEAFNRKVAIIMPREWKVPFYLSKRGKELGNFIDRVFFKFNALEPSEQRSPLLQCDICQICERLLKNSSWQDALDVGQRSMRARVVSIIASLDDKDTTRRALPWIFGAGGARASLDAVVERHGKDWLLSSLEWQSVKVANFDDNLALIDKISEYVANEAWSSTQRDSLFTSFEFSTATEGKALAKLAQSWLPHPEANRKRLAPAIKRMAGEGFMVLSFLAHIQGVSELDFMFKDLISLSYDHIIEPKISVEDANTGIASSGEYYDIICRILIGCYNLKLTRELNQLVGAFLRDAQSAPPERLRRYPPLLSKLVSLMNVDDLLKSAIFQNLYRGMLETLVAVIPDKPKPATTWSRPAQGCDICIQCEALDAFLIDSSQTQVEFGSEAEGFDAKARQHLETRVQSEVRSGAIKSKVFRYKHQRRLQLTKVDVQYCRERSAWDEHRDRAEALINSAHDRFWRTVLGERYSDLIALRSVRSTLAQPQEPNSELVTSSCTRNAIIQAAIARVSPEVIDLTSPPPKKRQARIATLPGANMNRNIDTQPQHTSSLTPAPLEGANRTPPALGPAGNSAINGMPRNQQQKRRLSESENTLELDKDSENSPPSKLPRTCCSANSEQLPNCVFVRASELQKEQEADVSTVSTTFLMISQSASQSAPACAPIQAYRSPYGELDIPKAPVAAEVSRQTTPQPAQVPAPAHLPQLVASSTSDGSSLLRSLQTSDQAPPLPELVDFSTQSQTVQIQQTFQMAGASNVPGAFKTFRRPQQQPPFAPRWLEDCLVLLQSQYPLDRFRACMDHIYDSENAFYYYVPAIICIECNGQKFFPGEGATVGWFRKHIVGADHRSRVYQNLSALAKQTKPQSSCPQMTTPFANATP